MTSDLRHYIMTEDELREKVLTEMGLRIVRFQNDEVVKILSHGDASRSAVVEKIKEFILQHSHLPRTASAG